jgi:hypothetical protein
MDRSHSTFDDEFQDMDTASHRRARALLIYAFAIRTAEDGDQRVQMIEEAAKANGTNAHAVKSDVSKLVDELQYFMLNGASSRWTASNGGFYDVLDGAYAMRCVSIDSGTKVRARGKFKCTLCGQIEQNCGYAVHFAGIPPIERGQELPKYSAKAFHTSDPEQLATAYSQYADSYNTAVGTSADEISERKWPVSPYLGAIFPGQTCLKRIFTAFSAQDFVRSMLDSTADFDREMFAFPFERIPARLVSDVASQLEQHFACARGATNPPYAHHNKDDHVFWYEMFERFSAGVRVNREEDTYAFLREGYLRMEKNVTKTGYCPECEDEDDEDDEDDDDEEEEDVAVRAAAPKRKRRRVIAEDDDESEEDGVDDEESSMEDFIENDSDEDHVDEDADLPTRPTPRWGQSSASRAGPFAVRRRAVYEPLVPRATRASRRRDEATSSSHAVSVADSEQETSDPVLRALASVDKHTARGLRAPPNNQIGSRRSTMIKLGDLAMSTLKEGDLTLSTGLFRALSVLTDTLSVHEVGCSLSPEQRAKKLKDVTDTLLLPIQARLLRSGQLPESLCVAEAIIVAHELLE